MALAFWRDKRSTTDKRNGSLKPSRAERGNGPDGNDPATALRIRARRRLIGAAALLLAAVIVVPLLLDPAPRPTSDNIPIDIPSEKQPFTPRLSLPPVPDPGQTPLAPPPDLPAAEPEKAQVESGATRKESAKSDASKPEATKPARPPSESKPAPKEIPAAKPAEAKVKPAAETRATESTKSRTSKILLQAAALSTDAAAQDLSERLRKAGFAPFTEKVDTADGVRFRVRVGPYATRDEAQRAQARLRALGVSATLVAT
jgi:DedD protein